MHKKSVAVLDIGSSKIEVAVGERGVNKTFIIKARKSFAFDGFSEGEFFNVAELKGVLSACADFIKKSGKGNTNAVYVGVPGEFTRVFVKDAQISFAKKKKIDENDINNLYESAFVMKSTKYKLINRSAIVYELDDYRRLSYPVGSSSEILKGKLSFVLCTRYFIDIVKPALEACGIRNIELVSTPLAEAMYLLEAEERDRIAMILDIGYITTTFSLIQGDGILYQNNFDYGGGYITAAITEKLDIDFNSAEELKRKVNLCRTAINGVDLISLENGEYYNSQEVKEIVKNSLDVLCENVSECQEGSGFNIPEYVPLLITGGGITYLRGAKEHLSGRLGVHTEIISPRVPLMDNPSESSLLSLLDLALEQQ